MGMWDIIVFSSPITTILLSNDHFLTHISPPLYYLLVQFQITMSPSLSETGRRWLEPTLEALTEAAIVLQVGEAAPASENGGAMIVFKNTIAKAILHGSSDDAIQSWMFENGGRDWSSIYAELMQKHDKISPSDDIQNQGGCPVHNIRAKGTLAVKARVSVESGDGEAAKQISMNFQPIIDCPESGERYSVVYIASSDDTSSSTLTLESYSRQQATMNASFDAMFTIDQNGTILFTNQAAVDLFGYDTIDDFFGQNVSMICGREHRDKHDSYLRHYLDTGVAKIMGKKRRVLAARRDGTEFPIELGIVELPSTSAASSSTAPTERYFSAFVLDLTQQEAHQADVMDQVHRTQALINASFDPMIEIDQRGIIQLANQATCSLFGYSRDEIIGSNISLICGGEHAAHHDGYLKRYLESGKARIIGRKREVLARRKDGTEFPVELGVQEVKLDNGEYIFCGFLRDLTSHKLLQESLQRQDRMIHDQFFDTGDEGSDTRSVQTGTSSVGSTPHSHRRHPRPRRSPANSFGH